MLKFQQRDRLKLFANPCVPVSGEGIDFPRPLFRLRQVDSLSAVQPHGTNPVLPGLRFCPSSRHCGVCRCVSVEGAGNAALERGGEFGVQKKTYLALVVFLWGFAVAALEWVLWKKYSRNVNDFKQNTPSLNSKVFFYQTAVCLEVSLQFLCYTGSLEKERLF